MEEEKKGEKLNIGISEERGEETLQMRPTEASDEKGEQRVSKMPSSAEDWGIARHSRPSKPPIPEFLPHWEEAGQMLLYPFYFV